MKIRNVMEGLPLPQINDKRKYAIEVTIFNLCKSLAELGNKRKCYVAGKCSLRKYIRSSTMIKIGAMIDHLSLILKQNHYLL